MGLIKKAVAVVLWCAITSGCGTDDETLEKFKRMCDEEYGETIYKTGLADGYYDDTSCIDCDRDLIKTNFKFIEFCSDNPSIYASIKESGCWRISKIKKEDGRCNHYVNDDNYKLAKVGEEPFKTFMENSCLFVEKLDHPMAEYGYYVDHTSIWLDKKNGAKVNKYISRIISIRNGDILSKKTDFSFTSKNSGNGTASPPIGCKYFLSETIYGPSLEKDEGFVSRSINHVNQ